MLFADLSAGTTIEEHDHDTENHGVITKGELIAIRRGGGALTALATGIT